ncbi:MAG: hypothetical protein NVS9B15_15190 [Acidobacteriaceae bacterium]
MRYLLAVLMMCALLPAQVGVNVPVREPQGAGFKVSPRCEGHKAFMSAALGREMGYCIVLPVGYADSGQRYPVLYLLHGLWGSENDWVALTKVRDYAKGLPLMIVMPEGDDGWYTNWATDATAKYEDYIFEDLPKEIAAKYQVAGTREATFIAGLSMGGYGALKGALKHPERYAEVGAFSSAFAARGRGSRSERQRSWHSGLRGVGRGSRTMISCWRHMRMRRHCRGPSSCAESVTGC